MKRAQGSVEFLVMLSVVLTLFILSVFIYTQNISEADTARSGVEANAACVRASTAIASVAALGNGANYTLNLPAVINSKEYTLWINSNASKVMVDYTVGNTSAGIACAFPKVNVTNTSGSALFTALHNATLTNSEGTIIAR
ncbi:MAG: hypothetical protein WC408_01220 [Candidatus Micrarchaeia archaeon]